MRFAILGPLQVRDDRGVIAVAGAKRRTLLIGLLAQANTPVAVEELIDWLWPQSPPSRAALAVQAHVSVLRRLLEPERAPGATPRVLVTALGGYLVRITPDELDALRFADLVGMGSAALRAGDPARAGMLLREALQLWRGNALADVRCLEAAQAEIARLEELRIAATVLRIDVDLQECRHLDVVPELSRLIIDHPLHERFYGQLMIALAGCGRRADAVGVYQRARRVLAEELDVEPGPDLQRIARAVLSGHAATAHEHARRPP